MQRRHLPIAILTGILFAVALVGYMLPVHSEELPTRVLLNTKAGKVIFAHKNHLDFTNGQCVQCHHTSATNDSPPPQCRQCHVKKFDEQFKKNHQKQISVNQCVACHHNQSDISAFDHGLHASDYSDEDCQACHHDQTIEKKLQNCSNCHKDKRVGTILSLQEANHTRCSSCHEDFFSEGNQGCTNCHTRKAISQTNHTACSKCHDEPTDQLIPTMTTAFHQQCKGCHEAHKAGPFGDDSCYKCHMK